jgi:hypothetical protein
LVWWKHGNAVPVSFDGQQEAELVSITRSGTSPQRLALRAVVMMLASEGHTNGRIDAALGILIVRKRDASVIAVSRRNVWNSSR